MHRQLMAVTASTVFCLPIGWASAQDAPAPYSGGASALELPEISIIVNMQADFTEPEDPDRHQKVRIKEAELALAGYLYPSIRGDFIAALEQEYIDNESETEIDLEEAYISFLDLPGELQAVGGRKLMDFGRLNAIHPHHWAFPETPLPLRNLFGDHPWYDDGLEVSVLVPNPADLYIKLSAGAWNGRALGHGHGDEDDHDDDEEAHEDEDAHDDDHGHADEAVIDWEDHVFTARLSVDLPASGPLSAQAGYSIAGDEGGRNLLQGVDLVVTHQAPGSFRKTRWHSEAFLADDDERGTSPVGFFSYLTYAPDKYWEIGGRYDFTERLEDDAEDAWAGAAFLTRYLTHTTYIRGGYQYTEASDTDPGHEHLASIQVVWGIGPHSHRLAD